jgi:DNA-directed RNA polymerase subunit RPC12/RpoP
MALIKCSECRREVSDKAAACPQCGAPVVVPRATATPSPAPVQAVATPSPAKQRSRPLTLVLFAILAVVAYAVFKMSTGSSMRGAIAGPQTMVAERLALKEGQAMGYELTLSTARRIEVTVDASPKAVNVMLMNAEDWQKYNQVRGKLFGGQYTYRQGLSRQSVLHMKQSEILPSGTWRVVVERPQESLFGKDTEATVSVVGY